MRWSYPFATRDCDGPVLAAQGDPHHVFDALASAGYDGVELLVREPARAGVESVESALAASGLAAAAVGTGPLVSQDRLALTDPDPARRQVAVERLKECVDLAQRLGTGVNVGKVRGQVAPAPAQAWGWMREGLLELADHAGAAGVCLTVEPQSAPGMDNLRTTGEGVAFVVELDHPNLKLMVDSFHAEAGDRWPTLAYVMAREVLRHVHVADSRRLPPGQGEFDLGLHVATLQAMGYDGFASFEINQMGSSLTTARDAIKYMEQIEL